GNVEEASLVNLLDTGIVIGDLHAGSLTVAAGARLRGQAEFGWDDSSTPKGKQRIGQRVESGTVACTARARRARGRLAHLHTAGRPFSKAQAFAQRAGNSCASTETAISRRHPR